METKPVYTAVTPADTTSSKEAQALALWQEWFDKGGYPLVSDGYETDDYLCVFCGVLDPNWAGHEKDCIYIRAKRLTGQP